MLPAGNAAPAAALLEVDPDLGEGLSADEFSEARRRALARVIELSPPSWNPDYLRAEAERAWLGLFVVDGLLIRRVTVGKRTACELFGPSDLFRPWDTDGEYHPLPISVDWLVLKPTRLAVLDTSFVVRVAPWPTINSQIVSRLAQRARYLALLQAVTHLPRADARLLILFWLLAERWGRVGADGVSVLLPLTHQVLAMLIGARRPTVTLALQRLTRAGFLIRETRDRWLLTNTGIECLNHPESLEIVEGSALGGGSDST
jgi:hypothetical protein